MACYTHHIIYTSTPPHKVYPPTSVRGHLYFPHNKSSAHCSDTAEVRKFVCERQSIETVARLIEGQSGIPDNVVRSSHVPQRKIVMC